MFCCQSNWNKIASEIIKIKINPVRYIKVVAIEIELEKLKRRM